MRLTAVALCLVLLVAPAAAQTEADRVLDLHESQQRDWIAGTRAKHQAQFKAQEIACYQKFAVNNCLIDSRKTEREVMADLRRQEILINDTQRKRRGAEQILRSDLRLHNVP